MNLLNIWKTQLAFYATFLGIKYGYCEPRHASIKWFDLRCCNVLLHLEKDSLEPGHAATTEASTKHKRKIDIALSEILWINLWNTQKFVQDVRNDTTWIFLIQTATIFNDTQKKMSLPKTKITFVHYHNVIILVSSVISSRIDWIVVWTICRPTCWQLDINLTQTRYPGLNKKDAFISDNVALGTKKFLNAIFLPFSTWGSNFVLLCISNRLNLK